MFIQELDALDAAFQGRKTEGGFGRKEVVGFVFSGALGCRWLVAGFENANRLLGCLGGSFFLGFLFFCFFLGKFGGIFPAGHDIENEQNTANGDDDPSFTIHDL